MIIIGQNRSIIVSNFAKETKQMTGKMFLVLVGIVSRWVDVGGIELTVFVCSTLCFPSCLTDRQTELTLVHLASFSLPTKTKLLLQKHHHPPHLSSFWWRCMQSPPSCFFNQIMTQEFVTNQRYATGSDRKTVTFRFKIGFLSSQDTKQLLHSSMNINEAYWKLQEQEGIETWIILLEFFCLIRI